MSQPTQAHPHSILNVEVSLNIDGKDFIVIALVDTGAEVNLIRKGLVPYDFLKTPPVPITLTSADSSAMDHGWRQFRSLWFGHFIRTGERPQDERRDPMPDSPV